MGRPAASAVDVAPAPARRTWCPVVQGRYHGPFPAWARRAPAARVQRRAVHRHPWTSSRAWGRPWGDPGQSPALPYTLGPLHPLLTRAVAPPGRDSPAPSMQCPAQTSPRGLTPAPHPTGTEFITLPSCWISPHPTLTHTRSMHHPTAGLGRVSMLRPQKLVPLASSIGFSRRFDVSACPWARMLQPPSFSADKR